MEIRKVKYTIAEVAKIFKIETSTVRYWETQFSQLHSEKSKGGDRVFTISDIEKINKVYHYLKVDLYTIEGAKRQLDNGYYKNHSKPSKKIKAIRMAINRINLF